MWIPLLLGVGVVAWLVNRGRVQPAMVVIPAPTVQQDMVRWYATSFAPQWSDLGAYAVVEVPGVSPYTPTLITQERTQTDAAMKMQDLSLPTMPGWFLAVIGPGGMIVNSRGKAPPA